MTDQGNKYLVDILQAIDLIESFTSEILDYDQYLTDHSQHNFSTD